MASGLVKQEAALVYTKASIDTSGCATWLVWDSLTLTKISTKSLSGECVFSQRDPGTGRTSLEGSSDSVLPMHDRRGLWRTRFENRRGFFG
jgi:hypothetical protein